MSEIIELKKQLRTELRRKRVEHAAALPAEVSALVFNRPPGPVLDLVPVDATIGLTAPIPARRPPLATPGSSSNAVTELRSRE
jgi:5-formyltetrahydrofolate cyclo-ligase